MQEKSDLK